jgi:hypothetical protein
MELSLAKSGFIPLEIPDTTIKLYEDNGLGKRILRSVGLCKPAYDYDLDYLGYNVGFAAGYLKPIQGFFLDEYLTHSQVMEILNKNRVWRAPTLREDMISREVYGKDHKIFDDDFGRSGRTWCGYMADVTKPYKGGREISGANGQPLVVRVLYYRYPRKEKPDEIGPIVMTGRSGVVPRLTKAELEKHKINLSMLEKLGIEIPSDSDQIVDVRSPLGYPLLVFDDLPVDKHGEHFYPPHPNTGEVAVVRRTYKHNGYACFRIDATENYAAKNLDITARPVAKGALISR